MISRRSFFAALAAPFLAKLSNVGLIAKPKPVGEVMFFLPADSKFKFYGPYRRPEHISAYTWNALSPAMKRRLSLRSDRAAIA